MENFLMICVALAFLLGIVVGGLTWFMGKFFHFAYVDLVGADIDRVLTLFRYKCPPFKRHQGVEIRLIPGFILTDKKGEKHEFQDFVRVSKMFFKPLLGDDVENYNENPSGIPHNTLTYLKETVEKNNLKITGSGYY